MMVGTTIRMTQAHIHDDDDDDNDDVLTLLIAHLPEL